MSYWQFPSTCPSCGCQNGYSTGAFSLNLDAKSDEDRIHELVDAFRRKGMTPAEVTVGGVTVRFRK